MRSRALFSALSAKLKNGQILFVDSFPVEDGKTKNAQTILTALESIPGFETINTLHKANNIFIALPEKDLTIERGLNNLPHVRFDEVRNLNLLDVLDNRYMIIVNPVNASEVLTSRTAGGKKKLSVTEPEAK
jgi:ribosomal protein L4